MRAAMAQRRFNPARGRLSSLSMLRILWDTSWAALQPLVLQHEAVPWAGGTVVPPNPPGSLSLELSPSRDLPAAPMRLHWGGGCLPVGAGVAQGWQVVCVGDEGSKRLLSRTHTLFWEELDACWAGKYSQRALWGGEGSTGVASSSVVCVVCVCGACVLSPGQVQILPLAAEMFCVDLPGDARGRQPSSFPMDSFQGLPFTAETGQLVPLVLGVPTPAGLSSPLHSAVREAGGAGSREAV